MIATRFDRDVELSLQELSALEEYRIAPILWRLKLSFMLPV